MAFIPVPKIKPGGKSLAESRAAKKSAADKALAACYKLVDLRDGRRCRVTGVQLTPLADSPRRRLERHHMRPRSTAPSERHNPANVITISQHVHQQIHAQRLHLEVCADGRVLLSQASEMGWQWVRFV